MTEEQIHDTNAINSSVNHQRRKLLLGAVCVTAASVTPAVLGGFLPDHPRATLSGKLVCYIGDPLKTLILKNHSDSKLVVNHISQGALMFDGSVIDCQAACLNKPITIRAHEEIQVQFDKRQQITLERKINDYRRIQSRVVRLADGTRVVPFVATVEGGVATLV